MKRLFLKIKRWVMLKKHNGCRRSCRLCEYYDLCINELGEWKR